MTEVEQLRAEIERLRAAQHAKLSFKVSEKGALSVYGLGRWPVTLYREQWERLLAAGKGIQAFMETNRDILKVKGAGDATGNGAAIAPPA